MPIHQPESGGWVLGGRYRVIDRIGSGGMAEVFRAHDELLRRTVAVKVFRSHADTADSSGGRQRRELELHTLARLSHPNLITLFDGSMGGSGEPGFLVMELIDGPSLAARLADGPLVQAEAHAVAIQIADALGYVHAQDMVHRDVKPANILLGTDYTSGAGPVHARLSDFGIVRLIGNDRLTSSDLLVGTASYMAPEQARGADAGPQADVYSLGLVMIEALTGVQCFPGPWIEAVLARLARAPEIPAELSQPWPGLLRSMTATDPAARPTAIQVAESLRVGQLTMAVMLPAADAANALPQSTSAGAAELRYVGEAAPRDLAAPRYVAEAQSSPRRRPVGPVAAFILLAATAVGGLLLVRNASQPSTPVHAPTSNPPTTVHSLSPASQSYGSTSLSNPATPTRSTPAVSTSLVSSSPARTSVATTTSAAKTSSAATPTSTPASSTATTTRTASNASSTSASTTASTSVTAPGQPGATSTPPVS